MMATGIDSICAATAAQRVIGDLGDVKQGPLLICLGGIHGNEPAGVEALERVIEALRQRKVALRGRFIALRGNIQGLLANQRYLSRDLNRMWVPDRIAELDRGEMRLEESPEHREQAELFELLESLRKGARGEVFVLDLHTTSAASKPFAIFGDTIRNRAFAAKLHVPLILGLEEAIAGTLIEHITNCGHVAVAFEAGQHEAPESVCLHEAAIWLALEASGLMMAEEIPRYRQHAHRLADAARYLPPVLEVCYRHAIRSEDRFKMEPGFVNFQRVYEGQLLARDRNGAIFAPKNYHVFMPLYQGLGDDGFFLARPVQPLWLSLSKVMRQLHADALLPLLPGVRRHPIQPNTFCVNLRIARWLVMEVFHLFGYRRERKENGVLVVSKRKYDLHGPEFAGHVRLPAER